jgi:hypothetical protein
MALKVTVPLTNTINTNVVSKKTVTKIENLQDIDASDVQDGYTLIFNAVTRKWEAAPAEEITLGIIDGGTF